MNSCTSALLSGLLALGIGPGDEVIVPGYTFIASIAAVVYAKAVPILAEIDDSLTIDPNDIVKKINKKTKAIIAVHMLGSSCDMDKIRDIAKKYKLYVIEDVAQACGGEYFGKKLGSFGDCGVFSLNIFKIITTGDGGVLTTNNNKLFRKAFSIHDHGFAPDKKRVIDEDSLIGLNFRMNELVGAFGLAQIKKITKILKILKRNKSIFKKELGKINCGKYRKFNDENGDCATSFVIIFDSKKLADKVAKKLNTITLINSGKHYYGNMLQVLNKKTPVNRGCPFKCKNFPSNVVYKKNMLPKTDDILSRSIAIGIGVKDRYLGTGFGITPLDGKEIIIKKARLVKKIIRFAETL